MAATSSKPAETILLVETVEDYLILLAPGEPFVVKPFTMAELKRKVRAALEYRSPFSRPGVSRGEHGDD